MLALSPEHKRARLWIQDRLWGSRAKAQGAASLRQSLMEIRRALGEARGVLLSDSFNVSLDPRLFETDIGCAPSGGDLLEGFDIAEEEFETWLRDQRQRLGTGAAVFHSSAHPTESIPKEALSKVSHNTIILVRGTQVGSAEAVVKADTIIDAIAKTLAELGAAEILDRRSTGGHSSDADDCSALHGALSLRSDVVGSDREELIRLALLQLPSNALAWSSTVQLSEKAGADLNDTAVMRSVNLVVNFAIDQFSRFGSKNSEEATASCLCHSGILHLYRLGKINFEIADKLFASAFAIQQRGIFLAWRAYLRTFLLAELQFTCRQTIEAEALDFMYRALEMEPHNSYVAGLSAHVQAMMRRSYVAAYELAERSVQLNHANPIGWACLGLAKSYLGKPEEGFRHTLLARQIAASAPFRYQLDALSCIAGTMAGELEEAIHLAEASHALAPTFAPPLRYLSALYAHTGKHDLSFDMVRKLQASEPDFTYERLRDKTYPAAGLHRTPIINSLPIRQI
jgi:tetratricopeptide (TPR) repeat protein